VTQGNTQVNAVVPISVQLQSANYEAFTANHNHI